MATEQNAVQSSQSIGLLYKYFHYELLCLFDNHYFSFSWDPVRDEMHVSVLAEFLQ